MTVIGACTIYAAEEGGSAEVNVQTKVSGTAPEKEVFTYTLKEQGASDNQERKLTVEGAGTGTFLLHYTQPGVYSYILKQESGTKADWTYDSEVYYVDVYVMWDEKMESLETVTVYFDSEGNKSEPVFENKYQQPEKRTQAVVKKVRSAKTGDEDILSGWAVLMILAAGTGVLAYRKKATRQRKS
nr:FctA domain-containing protein [[Ruminococcus] lactaris]